MTKTTELIIVAFIIAYCIIAAVRYLVREVKQGQNCEDIHCAGCALYEKCNKKNKKLKK